MTFDFTCQAGADIGVSHLAWQAIEAMTGFTLLTGVTGVWQVWAGGRTTDPCDSDTGIPEPHGWVLSGPPYDELGFVVVVIDPNGSYVETYEPWPGVKCAGYKRWPMAPDLRVEVSGTVTVSIAAEEWLVLSIDRRSPRESYPISPGQSGLPSDIDGVGYVEGSYVLGPKPGGAFSVTVSIPAGSGGSYSGTYAGPPGPDPLFTRLLTTTGATSRRNDAQWGNAPTRQATLTAKLWGRGFDFSCIGTGNSYRSQALPCAWLDGWSDGRLQWATGPMEFDNQTVTTSSRCYSEPITPIELDFRVAPGWSDTYPGTVRVRWHQGAIYDLPNGKTNVVYDRQYTAPRQSTAEPWGWFACDSRVSSPATLGLNGVEVRDLVWRYSLLASWLNSDRETGLREDNRDWRLMIDDVFTAKPVKLVIPTSYILDAMDATTGWSGSGCTISVDGDALEVVVTSPGASITKDFGDDDSIAAYRIMTLEAKGGDTFTFSVNGRSFRERTASVEFTRHDFDLCAPTSAATSDTTDHAMYDAATYQGPVYVRQVTIGDLSVGTYWFRNLGYRVAHRWGFTPTTTFREYYDWEDYSGVTWRWWRGMFAETDGRRVAEVPFRKRQIDPPGADDMLSVGDMLALLPSSVTVTDNTPPDTSERTLFLFGDIDTVEAAFVADVIYQADGSRLDLFRSRHVETDGLPVRLRFDELWVYSGFGNGEGNSTWDDVPYRITKRLRMPIEGLVVDPEANTWVVDSDVSIQRNAAAVQTVTTDEVGYFASAPLLYKDSSQISVALAVANTDSGTVSLPDAYPGGTYNDPAVASSGGWYVDRKARRVILVSPSAPPPEPEHGAIETSTASGVYVMGGTALVARDVVSDHLRASGTPPAEWTVKLRFYRDRLLGIFTDGAGNFQLAESHTYSSDWSNIMSFAATSALVEVVEKSGIIVLFYESGSQVYVRRSIDNGVSFSAAAAVTVGGSALAGTLLDTDYHDATGQLFLVVSSSGVSRLLASDDYGSTFTEVL